MTEPLPRYVVLLHKGIPEPHFDLMFEWRSGSDLVTLRLNEWPITPRTLQERLPDHRRLYLDYEGPISGGRGEVRRITSGHCIVEVDQEDSSVVTLDDHTQIRVPRA